jgi:acetyltransferase
MEQLQLSMAHTGYLTFQPRARDRLAPAQMSQAALLDAGQWARVGFAHTGRELLDRGAAMTIRNLQSMLDPRSAVLIGASQRPGSIGLTIARNLVRGGFKGAVDFVNPKYDVIEGRTCFRSVRDLPATPDLAIIATPPATIPSLISELGERGTRAAVIISAGLDATQKQEVLNASRPHCLRILGPNCIGLQIPGLGLDASFVHRQPVLGSIAFISQSGALVTAIVDWAAGRNIGFSHVISLGDMSDVDFGDLLDYLAGDITSRAILLYIEAVTSAPKFMSAARRAARVKPVIVIKAGRHAAGARAAASHTGALAGSNAAYDAAFRRAGLLRVNDLDELFEAAEILARAPQIKGERLMILTNGGGAGVLAADRVADFHGELASLNAETQTALDKVLPRGWSKGNPVDIIGDADPERYARALDVLLADKESDALLVLNCPTALSSSTDIARRVIETIDLDRKQNFNAKPVLTNWLGAQSAEEARSMFADAGLATFDTPGSAARGFMHMVEFRRVQDLLMRAPTANEGDGIADRVAAAAVIETARAQGRTVLSEAEGKSILGAYGIPVAQTHIAADAKAAVKAAEPILARGQSIVVKILSDDITHKSDIGGVRLDLKNAEAVAQATVAVLAAAKQHRPEARLQGVTVSPYIRRPHAHELIVGASVDPTFGPLILFGAGGTSVEAVADTALCLPPLDRNLALDAISRTRISRLLRGYRDRPAADMDAIANTLVRLATLVSDHPQIRELDVNPLLADETGVIALDARVRIASATDAPRMSMSVRPYPRQWETSTALPGSRNILLRPIKPQDEALYQAFFNRVTPGDMRLRFFTAKKGLSKGFVARLTQIDYAREMAFVAIDAVDGQLLGVARIIADPDYERAEYAILVRSDLQGQGLGWVLMQHLISYCRAEGLTEIYGSVLSNNTTMLAMCKQLGFKITETTDDAEVTHVALSLKRSDHSKS